MSSFFIFFLSVEAWRLCRAWAGALGMSSYGIRSFFPLDVLSASRKDGLHALNDLAGEERAFGKPDKGYVNGFTFG